MNLFHRFGFWVLRKLVLLTIHWPWSRISQLKLGSNVVLGRFGVFILHSDRSTITIGDGTVLSDNFMVVADCPIEIGKDCAISWRTSIMSHVHSIGRGTRPVDINSFASKPIKIGDRCFIGCNSVILPGVTLGNGCIVMANSVVKNSFPDNCLIGNKTAELIKQF